MAAVDRESPMLGEEFVAFDSDSESQGEAVDLSTADMDTACHRAVNDDMIYNNLEAGEETMAQLKGAGSVNGFLSNQGLQPRSYLMRLHVKTLPEVGVCLNDGTVMGARAVAADQSHAAMGGEQQERAESASQASGGNQGTVPVMDPAVHHQLTLAKGCPLHVPYDPRITILFDLNGESLPLGPHENLVATRSLPFPASSRLMQTSLIEPANPPFINQESSLLTKGRGRFAMGSRH